MYKDKYINLSWQNHINRYLNYCALAREHIKTIPGDCQWRVTYVLGHKMMKLLVKLHVEKNYKISKELKCKLRVNIAYSNLLWTNMFTSYAFDGNKHRTREHTKKAKKIYITAQRLLDRLQEDLNKSKRAITNQDNLNQNSSNSFVNIRGNYNNGDNAGVFNQSNNN